MDRDDDWIIVITVVVIVIVAFPSAIAAFFSPARTFLVEHQVLVTDGVVLPIGDGAGLDLGRILIVGAAVGVALLVLVAALVARSRQKAPKEQR